MNCLFSEGKIGSMVLKHRIIMTAIHTGYPLEQETAFLARRVKGGAAAVTAVMGVSKTGTPSNMSLLEKPFLEDLRTMAKAVHREGGKLIIQLFHAGRNCSPGMLSDPKAAVMAPSPIPSPIYKNLPKEMTKEDIEQVVTDFGNAVMLCREAGVDAVEISCSAGYLLSEFFSPLTNQRVDKYGGSPENRLRFPLEVVKAVRQAAGKTYPVILRVSAADMLGGYGIQETISLLKKTEKYLDAVNVTGGWHESEVPQISMHVPEGGFAFLAKEIKGSVKIPVIACNRINNEEIAEATLAQGYSDFVGCARAFLTDPDYVRKMKLGIPYRRCIACNKGCIERVLKMEEATCIFNPEAGKDTAPAYKNESGRRTLVIGGGPAGMEAALQCAKRGDFVQLCTDEERVGGLLHAASQAPYKATIAKNIKTMRLDLERSHVEVKCNTFVDAEYIEQYNPDFVVVATGSRPVVLPIPGVKLNHVYTAQQVLLADDSFAASLRKGEVFILGGGSVGLETALYLAKKLKQTEASLGFLSDFAEHSIAEQLQCSADITVVEMGPKMGAELGGLRRIMLKELAKYGVELITNTKVEEIIKDKVVLNTNGIVKVREADFVILAAGYTPSGQPLIKWLAEKGVFPYKVIGDADKVGTIGKALKDANDII